MRTLEGYKEWTKYIGDINYQKTSNFILRLTKIQFIDIIHMLFTKVINCGKFPYDETKKKPPEVLLWWFCSLRWAVPFRLLLPIYLYPAIYRCGLQVHLQ